MHSLCISIGKYICSSQRHIVSHILRCVVKLKRYSCHRRELIGILRGHAIRSVRYPEERQPLLCDRRQRPRSNHSMQYQHVPEIGTIWNIKVKRFNNHASMTLYKVIDGRMPFCFLNVSRLTDAKLHPIMRRDSFKICSRSQWNYGPVHREFALLARVIAFLCVSPMFVRMLWNNKGL